MGAMTRKRKKKYNAHMAEKQLELENQKKMLVKYVKMESRAAESLEKTQDFYSQVQPSEHQSANGEHLELLSDEQGQKLPTAKQSIQNPEFSINKLSMQSEQ